MNLDRLVKLLNLTTSDADGEALNAIRAANSTLSNEKKTWSEVIHVAVEKSAQPMPQIARMFLYLQKCKLESEIKKSSVV